ncbi:hypothetical protein F4861DRAFT_534059 [Xylaria intraflava]|nr:hypothetical protein F4861DRAFT_534059 [Xylaria intraflava]
MDTPALPNGQPSIVYSQGELVSLGGLHAIIWTGFALCVVGFSVRAYIRIVCFRRFFVDDYLMLVSLFLLAGTAVAGQISLGGVYTLVDAGRGVTPGPDFSTEVKRGLLGFGIHLLLSFGGLWLIKLSFLAFFYRLGHNVAKYRLFWWLVSFFVVATGVVEFGITQYPCLFGPLDYILVTCKEPAVIIKTDEFFKTSVIIDVVSDVLIICFPIVILWSVRINLRRKLILAGIFSLVVFTIGATVVRGSIFGGVFKSFDPAHPEEMNITCVEFIVSYLIGCLVSFRSLFTQERPRHELPVARPIKGEAYGSGRLVLRERARRIHQSILNTFRTLEANDEDMTLHPFPPPSTATGYWRGGGYMKGLRHEGS